LRLTLFSALIRGEREPSAGATPFSAHPRTCVLLAIVATVALVAVAGCGNSKPAYGDLAVRPMFGTSAVAHPQS
jgi:hypothetical protein